MAKLPQHMKRFFQAKRRHRRMRGTLPVEDKYKLLLELQKTTSSILQQRGVERTPWDTVQFRILPSLETIPNSYLAARERLCELPAMGEISQPCRVESIATADTDWSTSL